MSGKRSFLRTYRLIPIVIVSLLVFSAICAFAILIWGSIAFFSKANVATVQTLPKIIWLTALFLASGVMTLLTKGGTVFPALSLAFITVIISCFFVGPSLLTINGFFVKLGYSLLFSILGFVFTKLYLIIFHKSKRGYDKLNFNFPPEIENFDDINDHGFSEYKRKYPSVW